MNTLSKCHFPLSVMQVSWGKTADQILRHDTYDTYDTSLHPTQVQAHAHPHNTALRLQTTVISVMPSFFEFGNHS